MPKEIKFNIHIITMRMQEKFLKRLISEIREFKDEPITSDDLGEEQLFYLQQGFTEGLAAAAMLLADELDMLTDCEFEYLEHEEEWWHPYYEDFDDDLVSDEDEENNEEELL